MKRTRPHLLLSVVAIFVALGGATLVISALVGFFRDKSDRFADPVSPLLSPELIFGLMFLALASYLEILRDLGAFIREGRAFFVDARRFLKSQTAEASLSEDPKEKTP